MAAWILIALAAVGALSGVGWWIFKDDEVEVEDPAEPTAPRVDRHFALTRAVMTDVMVNQGDSHLVKTLSREDLEIVLAGAGGLLEASLATIARAKGASSRQLWQYFCLDQERKASR